MPLYKVLRLRFRLVKRHGYESKLVSVAQSRLRFRRHRRWHRPAFDRPDTDARKVLVPRLFVGMPEVIERIVKCHQLHRGVGGFAHPLARGIVGDEHLQRIDPVAHTLA